MKPKLSQAIRKCSDFLVNLTRDYSLIARVIVTLMNIPQPWVLSIDRTEWSFGQTRFNIFMRLCRTSRSSLSFGVDNVGEERQFSQ